VHNLVISNVPGPPVPLYFMGGEIVGLYPLGPVFHGAGLNITVMSNDGNVHVGVISCRESMPEVDDLARRFPAELTKLKEAVGA
jgi:diacylglycerol O-acyltransferase